jgi:aminoglycoside phosphotransferase (APT) family kinase protein
MINEEAIRSYLFKTFDNISSVAITKLGAGVQGAGFLIEMDTPEGPKSYVVKGLFPEGLGHDYPSDRAAVFLLDLETYDSLPRHVKAVDVLSEQPDGTVKSIGGGREYYLLMERGEGRDYFKDLSEFAGREKLGNADIARIEAMASYLAEIHSVKKESRQLYWRKIRDTIGHGECLMGVFDTYPDGTLGYDEMAEIEKLCIDWRARLKPKTRRLCQIHGDFHPGNIWFRSENDFILLDRSRGPWGEPADDLTALAVNYIFFSVKHHGEVRGAYLEGLRLFFEEYVQKTGDEEICGVVAPFFAFRAVVVANPVFYPELGSDARRKIFNFTRNLLKSERFEIEKVNGYLAS